MIIASFVVSHLKTALNAVLGQFLYRGNANQSVPMVLHRHLIQMENAYPVFPIAKSA